jgi:tetratricopeptide (TPR) repeat protein
MASENPKPKAKPASGAASTPADRSPKPARRINFRALIVLSVIFLVAIPGMIALRYWQTNAQRSSLLKQAKTFKDEKDPQRALTYVNRYLEQVPSSADGLALKADLLSMTAVTPDQINDALVVNDQAMRAMGKDATLEMKRRAVELNIKSQKFQTAATLAREILGDAVNAQPGKDKNGDPQTHRMLALALYAADMQVKDPQVTREVVRHLELAWQADPEDIAIALDLAQVYSTRSANREEGRNRSFEVLDKIVRSHPESVEIRLARFRLYVENDEFDKALEDAKEAVRVAPDDFRARLAYADVLRLMGDNVGALEQIDAIPEKDRVRTEVRLSRGLAEMTGNKLDRAVQEWRRGLVESGGNDPETTWQLAFVLLNQGQLQEAEPLIEQYKRLTGAAETTPEAAFLDGVKELRRGRFDEAITQFETHRAKLNPVLVPQANFMLGQAYQAKGQTVQAVDAYRRAAKDSTRWPTPWLALAEVAAGTGNLQNALGEINQGLTALPGDPVLSLAMLRLLWRSELTKPQSQRDYTSIERLIRQMDEKFPRMTELTQFKAEYVAVRGNFQEALENIAEAAAKDPSNLSLWISWANGQARAGQFPQALDTLKKIREKVGDKAVIRLVTSQIASAQGDENLAREALSENVDPLPDLERVRVYRALGDLLLKERDLTGATKAYEAWQKIKPDDPAAGLALVQVALSGTDEALIRRRVDALKGMDAKDLNWRLARIQELLRVPPDDVQKPDRIEARLNEALTFANFIIESGASQAQGLILRAAVQERRGKLEDAVTDLRKALEMDGGAGALRPLCQALARQGKFNDIDQLRVRIQAFPQAVDQMICDIALQTGKADIARKNADRIVESNPEDIATQVWYARVLNRLGQNAAAEESLQKYAERRGSEPSPWIALLIMQTQNKNTAGVEKTLRLIREKVKSDRPDLMLAQAYEVAGLPAEAEEYYGKAVKLFPDDTRTAQSAIEYYGRYGRKIEAETLLREMLKRNPNLNWAKRRLALSLSERVGDEAAWKESYDLISASSHPQGTDGTPDDEPINDRLVRAIVLARGAEVKRRDAAIAELERLIPTLAVPTLAHEVLARIYSDDYSKLKQAVHHAEIAASMAPNSVPLAEFCVNLAMRSKDLPLAEKHLARLDLMDPGSLRVASLKARVMAGSGKDQEAAALLLRQVERLKAAAQLDPQRETETVNTVRQILREMVVLGPFDKIEPSLRRVVTLWPRLSHVLAPSLANLGRTDEAVTALKQGAENGDWTESTLAAVGLATRKPPEPKLVAVADELIVKSLEKLPNQTDILQAQAYLRHFQGKFEDEVAIYDKIRGINPRDIRYLNNMAWTLAENLKKYDEAMKIIDDAISRIGRRPSFLDTKGVILTRMGRHSEAITELESALQAATIISDGQPLSAIYFHLARAYMLNDQPDKAKTYFEAGKSVGLSAEQLEASEQDDFRKLLAIS